MWIPDPEKRYKSIHMIQIEYCTEYHFRNSLSSIPSRHDFFSFAEITSIQDGAESEEVVDILAS